MTQGKQGDTRTIVSMQNENGTGVLHMDDVYDTDIDDLWSALTKPDRLARWIVRVDGDLGVGGDFEANFVSGWEGRGTVDVCEPPRRLLVTTTQDGGTVTTIEAQLSADGERTRLIIEERGTLISELAAHGAGWQAHIEDLVAYLDGRPTSDWETRWHELSPVYEELATDLG